MKARQFGRAAPSAAGSSRVSRVDMLAFARMAGGAALNVYLKYILTPPDAFGPSRGFDPAQTRRLFRVTSHIGGADMVGRRMVAAGADA
ncbi:hypothetical protein WJ969_06840 [Achromobacter xylosoxidans]